MSDPDPSEAQPPSPGGLRRLFRRRGGASAQARSNGPDAGAVMQQDMRLRIQDFQSMSVDNVMVPRADVKALEASTSFADVIATFADVTHSRLPVYRETLDDPIGFVHIKDVVAEIAREGETPKHPLERLHRNVLYVPPSMKLTDLLVKMQSTRIHLALVVDEYGGTDGLVTLEDLVEEIVGDIEDEHDKDVPKFVRRSQRVWEADARAEIDDFAEETGLDLSLAEVETDIGTLGGVAFALAGQVPVRGQVLPHPSGVELEIVDADARRIRRLRVRTPEVSKPQE